MNDSAVAVLGDETLRLIAQELVRAVRGNITIDWAVRENVRAKMRVLIKRYGYQPAKQAGDGVGDGAGRGAVPRGGVGH